MNRILAPVLAIFLVLGVVACTDSARSMYENAQFEELQNNPAHAAELYEEILDKYPESEYATKARERLKQMRADEH